MDSATCDVQYASGRTSRAIRNRRLLSGGTMIRTRLALTLCLLIALTILRPASVSTLTAAASSPGRNEIDAPQKHTPGTFTIDVAMDGRTWRMNDTTNPFFPVFTGQLMRGNTFIVNG